MIPFNANKFRVAMMMGNAVLAKAAMIMMAYFFGTKLDNKFETTPWIMLALVCLAMGLGLWYLLHVAKKNKLTE